MDHHDESKNRGNVTIAATATAGEEEEVEDEGEENNNKRNRKTTRNFNIHHNHHHRRTFPPWSSSSEDDRGRGSCGGGGGASVWGKTMIMMVSGSLVYYHCAYRESSLLSLLSDVFIVLLCSLAILGLLFRQMNIQVPVDPLEWQISQDSANTIFACLANTLGAAESVLRVAATGHDKRLFLKVFASLYILSALGRLVSGVALAYAGLCLFCLYVLAENSPLISTSLSRFFFRREDT